MNLLGAMITVLILLAYLKLSLWVIKDCIVISKRNDYTQKTNYVYICSPYRGKVELNTMRAKKYCTYAVEQGYIPVCPHIYYTQFLDDNVEGQRTIGLDFALKDLARCSELWLFTGEITEGMVGELIRAEELGIAVVRKEIT